MRLHLAAADSLATQCYYAMSVSLSVCVCLYVCVCVCVYICACVSLWCSEKSDAALVHNDLALSSDDDDDVDDDDTNADIPQHTQLPVRLPVRRKVRLSVCLSAVFNCRVSARCASLVRWRRSAVGWWCSVGCVDVISVC